MDSKIHILRIFNEDSNLVSYNGEPVFLIVEEMPKFNGQGQDAFRQYIMNNLVYPEICKLKKIQGKVYVQFLVNSKGKVDFVHIVRGADPALNKEAIRVVMSSPDWEPGMQRGKNVNVMFTFPIEFKLK